MLLTFFVKTTVCWAQFETVSQGKGNAVSYYMTGDDDNAECSDTAISFPIVREDEIVDKTDERLRLLKRRMRLSLPLPFIRITSGYGYRQDPFTHKRTFHDGIDLRCRYQPVYAMMGGIVENVGRGNHGYGNFVVLRHGEIRCLYGHLSDISVVDGQIVKAGQQVAISGNTGKSTAPHLHLRITIDNKSMNPLPLLAFVEGSIAHIDSRLDTLDEDDGSLTITNLWRVMGRYGVHHREMVLAQAIIETGWFSSRLCVEDNNIFGLRRPSDGQYYVFDDWRKSVKAYRDYVQYKYNGGDYLMFLKKIGYAEDKEYIRKVGDMARKLSIKE